MFILELQIVIETILSILLIIGIATAFYSILNIKKITIAQKQISEMKKDIKNILHETEHDINKIKIKNEILKNSIQKTIKQQNEIQKK